MIPRAALFGNPAKAGGQISPDGARVTFLAPHEGVLNIWLAAASDPEAARPITHSRERPIQQYFWSPDSRSVLYIQDKGGDENFLLYGIDVATGVERTLTPFDETRAVLVGTSTLHRGRILVGLNNRDPRFHDVHSLDLTSGDLTLVLENAGFAGFFADNTLQLRMALRQNAQGGTDYFRIVDGTIEDEPFALTSLEDALTTQPAGYTADGSVLYWLDSRGRNTAALIAEDTVDGRRTVLGESAVADVGGVLVHPVSSEVEAYAVNDLRNAWTALDPKVGKSLDWLEAQLGGDVSVLSRTDADDRWIVSASAGDSPPRAFLYDRLEQRLTPFYVTRPELEGAPLVAMHPVEIAARDGQRLVSYLSLPPGSDSDGAGVPDRPLPMVLLVHGGPWARDAYGFNAYHQWLANRGYAVLSPNFRGSTGFGKAFISAGDLEWGRAMHDDLLDAVSWAVDRGIAQGGKVAIMGGSYGGYATLAGLAFTPEAFACGVDIVGPSNLETLLATIPAYWVPLVEQFHQRMGNPTTPEGLAMLKERSPLYKAGEIVRPLLIGQGANDPRVNRAESDQIVAAMNERGVPVSYVLFPDEGHGFHRPENNIAFNAIAENFLATCLGGRAEPIGETVARSTAEIVTGAEHVKGLDAALAVHGTSR